MGAGCSAPGAGCAGGDLRCCGRGRVPAGSPGMEGQAGVLSPARGAGCRGLPCPGSTRTERVRGSRAWPQLRERFCARGTMALPLVLPAGWPRDGESGCRPPAGLPVGKERSRHRQGSTGGSLQVPVGAQHGRAAACAHWAGCPCGPWLFVGAGGGLGGPAGRRRTFGGAGAGAVGVRPRPRRHWCGAGPSPGGCWLLLCATAAAAAAAVWGWAGGVQPDPGSRPLSRGERGRRWAPVPVSPSPPVAGARHRGAAAQSAGQSRPCPGGSRVCRGGSSSGALWAQSDCPTSLPVQGRTDGWTEDPSHAGSCGAPRKKPGCLRPGRRCRLPRSWLGTALPRPAGDAAAPAQLFGPPFVLGPVPIAGAVGLVVRAPVCCCSSSWTAPVPFAGPAQLWFLFQLVDGSGSFPCPLADGSSSSLAAAPAPRHFQLVCGSSSCLLKRSWLLARS